MIWSTKMKFALTSTALVVAASMVQAQQDPMQVAMAMDTVPCGGSDNIANAVYDTNDAGQQVLKVECARRGLFAETAPAGAPATGFVPAFGVLGPILGIGAAGAAVALGVTGGGTSTPDSN
jgi:hypothetical protein